MTTTETHIDLSAFKERQRWTWASGDSSVIATRITLMAERPVDAAGLRAGDRVLDVATGTGNAAIAAARGGGGVIGVDYVEALFERGRRRAATEGSVVTCCQSSDQ
jgi:cyclopropane fatty-acyl-phospholipid synthase-like methyltransferase